MIPTNVPHDHRRPTLFGRPDRLADPLYVVTVVYNPVRFRSRWRLYEDFAKHVAESGAVLYTVEAAFGDRDFVVTEAANPCHVQVRTSHELWIKENLVNVGVARLPLGWKYVAYVDADIQFARPDWADETRHLLQHYQVIQMFSQFQDLSPEHEVVGTRRGFVSLWEEYGDLPPLELLRREGSYYGGLMQPVWGFPGAPGLCWAFRREAWDALGGLLETCILGSGDWWMAHALIGRVEASMKRAFHPRYVEKILTWQDRALRHIKRNIGVMPGLVLHNWHGKKSQRGYGTRDQILVDHQFNPDTDLKRDWQGVLQLEDRKWRMRDAIRAQTRSRNEDSIDV